jgi:hypothetical protein
MVVGSEAYYKLAQATNFVAAYQRKTIGHHSQSLLGVAAGSASAPLSSWRGHFHTGHGATYVSLEAIVARPDAGTDPYMDFTVTNATTDVLYSTSTQIHYPLIDAAATDVADEWALGACGAAVEGDTSYYYQVRLYDYMRPISCVLYERAAAAPDDTTTAGCDPRYSVGAPILDAQLGDLATALCKMLRNNRAHLIAWAALDGSGANSIAGTTYTNILDGTSTSVSATTPGWRVETAYHETAAYVDVAEEQVPCVLAVHAGCYGLSVDHSGWVKIAGAGIVSTEIEIDGAPGWYYEAAWLPAGAALKIDVLAKAGAADENTRVDAVALYELIP